MLHWVFVGVQAMCVTIGAVKAVTCFVNLTSYFVWYFLSVLTSWSSLSCSNNFYVYVCLCISLMLIRVIIWYWLQCYLMHVTMVNLSFYFQRKLVGRVTVYIHRVSTSVLYGAVLSASRLGLFRQNCSWNPKVGGPTIRALSIGIGIAL